MRHGSNTTQSSNEPLQISSLSNLLVSMIHQHVFNTWLLEGHWPIQGNNNSLLYSHLNNVWNLQREDFIIFTGFNFLLNINPGWSIRKTYNILLYFWTLNLILCLYDGVNCFRWYNWHNLIKNTLEFLKSRTNMDGENNVFIL